MNTPHTLAALTLAAAMLAAMVAAAAGPAAATSQDLSTSVRTAKAKALTTASKTSYNAWKLMREHRGENWVRQYGFNWKSDGCDNSPDKPGGFDFRMPCARHDFGYANTKHLVGDAAWKSTYKKQVDGAFLFDMLRVCSTHGSGLKYRTCKQFAATYFYAVSHSNR